MKHFRIIGCLVLALLGLGCGKKGPILPPLEKIPQSIVGLSLRQIGAELHLTWRAPTSYVDGSPLEGISAFEVWLFEADRPEDESAIPAGPDRMAGEAELWRQIPQDSFAEFQADPRASPLDFGCTYTLDLANIDRKRYGFAVKVCDHKGRFSDFSSWVTGEPLAPAVSPSGVEAELSRNKITLKWLPPEKNIDESDPADVTGYNVYRSVERAPPQKLNSAPVRETSYEDKTVEFEKLYTYFIRAVSGESEPYAESLDSEPVNISARDTFPPAAPKGLIAISGENSVSLTWEINQERDVARYRVWRRIKGTPTFELLTEDGIDGNSYMDSQVQKTARYEYAITAVDRNENESPMSELVTVVVQGGRNADL
jgi:hypothetical protein